jgi:hypothetical protein
MQTRIGLHAPSLQVALPSQAPVTLSTFSPHRRPPAGIILMQSLRVSQVHPLLQPS